MGREFTCTVQVRLHEPDAIIMNKAAELGRRTGRDEDWFPASLNEAVQEIIFWSDGPLDHGLEIIG